MTKRVNLVRLKEVLSPISRREGVDPEAEYRILGAHWYAQGLYTKALVKGAEIRAASVYRVEVGDFVYNRLFAWKGSFALAVQENHDCYVSNEFPCFTVNEDLVYGPYLWRYFSRPQTWAEALQLSSGGTPTSRNRLKEEKFLSLSIPLPPVAEQKRIVDLLDRIDSARALHEEIGRGLEDLTHSILERAFKGQL